MKTSLIQHKTRDMKSLSGRPDTCAPVSTSPTTPELCRYMKTPNGCEGESLAPLRMRLLRRCATLQWILTDKAVFGVIACVLITSGVAKCWVLVTDPFVEIKTGYPVLLIATAVIVEFAVAYLLVAKSFELKAIASLFLFSMFLIVSLIRLAVHSLSCGCFGTLNVSPLLSFLLNAGVVASVIWMIRRSGGMRRILASLSRSEADLQSLTRIGGLAFALLMITAISETSTVEAAIAAMLNG